MTAMRKRVAILISGRGSNMGALIRAAGEGDFPAEIVGVVSDNPDAEGLKRAALAGIEARAVSRGDFADKPAHEAAIQSVLDQLGAELICLAGFMRMLSSDFVYRWSGRMINIHPSLLPSFKGLDTHRRAIEAGIRIHGCTVHFVTPDMDSGPIIAQAAVPVHAEDDADSLAARVLKAEHQLYPLALRMVAADEVRMEDGGTIFTRPERHSAAARMMVSPSPASSDNAVDLEWLARFTP